ncbi:MAG TPA: hypothetical protein VGR20_22720 [Acidimicrobiia bacterium]|nr:hypothetical protein [Acidimicrobiia bacterium]
MWVEGGDIHDELFDQLGAVLTVPEDLPLTPSAAELEALAAVVSARWPGAATAPGAPAPAARAAVQPLRAGAPSPLRRVGSSAWRAGSAAAAIVVFSASAAAAAGGVPLPRPVRAVAFTVGLPVDSPALDDTNHHIKELKAAVKANDKPKAVATANRLRADLAKVPAEEKKEAAQKVDAVMVQATPLIQNPETTTAATPAPASTTATSPASSTTATTEAADEKAPVATTTTAPPTSTTTAPEKTTTTTAPETDGTTDGTGGTSSGETGTGDGDHRPGDPPAGGSDPGPTTDTTTPEGETTTTTAPPAGEDPSTTTTTTTTTSTTTTTTTMPEPVPGQ